VGLLDSHRLSDAQGAVGTQWARWS
jgi:hypothetical protein